MNRICLAVMCASVVAFGCAASEPKTEFKAVSTTQDVMAGLMDPAAQTLWKAVATSVDAQGVHETKPQTKEEWQKLAFTARGLAESSTLLLFEGRIEDHGDWEKYTKEITAKALDAAKAAEDQDAEKVVSIGGDIYDVCTKCHEGYLDKVMAKRTGGKPPETPSNAPGAAPSAPGTK
jgi:outer membrane translocation and assembly module TamA